MNERIILTQLANQTANRGPAGSSVSDVKKAELLTLAQQQKIRDNIIKSEIIEFEARIRSFGEEPLSLPPDSTLDDIVFFRERQLDTLDPEIVRQTKGQVARIIKGLFGLEPLIPESVVESLPPGPLRNAGNVARNLSSPVALGSLTLSAPVEVGVAVGSELSGEIAAELGAPVPVQIGVEAVGNILGRPSVDLVDDLAAVVISSAPDIAEALVEQQLESDGQVTAGRIDTHRSFNPASFPS